MKQLYFESAKNIAGYNNGVDIWKVFETPKGFMLCDIVINDPLALTIFEEEKIDNMRMEVTLITWNVERAVKRNLKESLDKSK